MRLSLRFIIPLGLAIGAIAYGVLPLVDQLTFKWFVRDLDIRAALIANAMQEPLGQLVQDGNKVKVQRYLNRATQDERLFALGFCDDQHNLVYKTALFPTTIKCAGGDKEVGSEVLQLERGPVHVAVKPVQNDAGKYGTLVVAHDMSFIQRRSEDTKRYLFYLFVGIAAIVSLVTVVIAELSWRGWLAGIKALIRGEAKGRSATALPQHPELQPVARDLREMIREMQADRISRDAAQVTWTPEALRSILHDELKGDEIIIVSNREPYIHENKGGSIQIQRPASGLVTALEPIMRACSGTWIAHGSGSADRQTVDRDDHFMAPPEAPSYRIRRVWLSEEEEQGYYYGFANEGLWPLCHIAHVRPTFRTRDWDFYVQVNRRFANAVEQEAKTSDPIVLVQDYHFALLPRMIRTLLPSATIITFWHIPWPNPETFGICPWREALLDGLLGSSILGFHTQFHCNNFFDTSDRYLEARVDREIFTVTYGGNQTVVNRYPISIEWPPSSMAAQKPVSECRTIVREREGWRSDAILGIGLDRLDYTKGILERFMAIERLLELEPQWIGKFVFIQIAAPTRSALEEYQNFDAQVRAMAARINQRFARSDYQPICLKIKHHDAHQVYEYYRASDLCVVSSLHDGMNLVAKEYVAAHEDEQGVLILSQFAGASKELAEALVVNPYDIDQCAAALHLALTMSPLEQRQRMRSMRGLVQEFNVYRWAGRMLLDAARMRRRHRVLKPPVPLRDSKRSAA